MKYIWFYKKIIVQYYKPYSANDNIICIYVQKAFGSPFWIKRLTWKDTLNSKMFDVCRVYLMYCIYTDHPKNWIMNIWGYVYEIVCPVFTTKEYHPKKSWSLIYFVDYCWSIFPQCPRQPLWIPPWPCHDKLQDVIKCDMSEFTYRIRSE